MPDFLNFDSGKTDTLNKEIHNDPIRFAEVVLGISLHAGQINWMWNSTKRLNILRPGNRFGKTLVTAIKHIWHCMCKPKLDGKVVTHSEWLRVEYNTLNFGPTYELGRGALMLARDMIQGNILLPDGSTNKSMLKDWAITNDKSESSQLPFLEFKTGSKMFGRSMNEMGVAFKMRKLAYISGDECADVPNLWTFTNNTLLMRVVDMDGSIDFVGTPQPEGYDYMVMIEQAEEDMAKPGWKSEGFYYVQKGSIYENTYLPKTAIMEIERISDPNMREQIIRGEYVEVGDKYFGYERIQNAVDKDLDTIDYPEADHKYVTAFDPAGGESQWADYTVILTVDYTNEPFKVINIQRFKGGDVSLPMQYQLVSETVTKFGSKLLIDSSSLGGKNAMAFLSHLQPITCDFGPTKGGSYKSEMLATLKIAFDGGQSPKFRRDRVKNEKGEWIEKVPEWGLIKIPNIPVLINELINYKLDDHKLRQDTVMALGMAIHWIEMRRPKFQKKKAMDLDFYSSGII